MSDSISTPVFAFAPGFISFMNEFGGPWWFVMWLFCLAMALTLPSVLIGWVSFCLLGHYKSNNPATTLNKQPKISLSLVPPSVWHARWKSAVAAGDKKNDTGEASDSEQSKPATQKATQKGPKVKFQDFYVVRDEEPEALQTKIGRQSVDGKVQPLSSAQEDLGAWPHHLKK